VRVRVRACVRKKVPFGDFGPERCFAAGKTNIVDARTHLPEGKKAWTLEKNGFCFVERPAYSFEDHLEQVQFEVNKQASAPCLS